ncbi:MAG: hypothetical protein E6X17_05315 [Sporomusaceae bacterium]|nr:hypothetical protein [Sporomusaceae bacterium]
MANEFYADKISHIYVNGGMVRIDFVSLNPAVTDPEGNPSYTAAARVVMPLAGFAEAFSLHQNILGQLVERGVITITPPPAAEQSVQEEADHEA